jgi:hypothetical protein
MAAETVAQYLEPRGHPVAEENLVQTLEETLGDRISAPGAAALSPATEQVFVEHSGMQRPPEGATVHAVRETTAAVAASVQTSLSVAEVAAMLGVDASRIRHRLSDRGLYSIRVGRVHRLPSWQFHDGQPLPGLRGVLAALPADLHPLVVEGFMSTPQPELDMHDAITTPRHWLAHGGDPTPVYDLARGFDEPY